MTSRRIQEYRDQFFGGGSSSIMSVNGLKCTLHMPLALEQKFENGVEVKQGLPPSNPRKALRVDDFREVPDHWMLSEENLSSYMVPIVLEHGMWLDFNGNNHHAHDVAVMISSQGACALTMQDTAGAQLEQYKDGDLCPEHKIPFADDRRCKECGHRWEPQNYVATTTCKPGYFWLDGFMTEKGVRQFVFTEDITRSVAEAILGEDRLHCLAVQFYLSKKPKPQPKRVAYRSSDLEGLESASPMRLCAAASLESSIEVAAGARIDQDFFPDPNDLDYWNPEPAGTIVINYTDVETANRVVAGGEAKNVEGRLGRLNVKLGHGSNIQ